MMVVLFWGLTASPVEWSAFMEVWEINKLLFFHQRIICIKKFQLFFTSVFWSSKPWILKCWIWIRIQWIQIYSSAALTVFCSILVRRGRSSPSPPSSPQRWEIEVALTGHPGQRFHTVQFLYCRWVLGRVGSSVVDPYWFHCGSGSRSSFTSQCGSRSRYGCWSDFKVTKSCLFT